MPELPSPEAFGDYDAWRGRAVTDRDGARVGSVDELYLDTDTRRPEWVLIRLDDDDDQRRFVPLADARVADDTLQLAHGRDRIAAAPAASPGPIPQGEERSLYDHYAVPVTESESETVLPTEGAPSTDEHTQTTTPEPEPKLERPAAVVSRPDSAATTDADTRADAGVAGGAAAVVPDVTSPGPAPADTSPAPLNASPPPELVADEGAAPPELTTPSTPSTPGAGGAGEGAQTPPPIPTPAATDAGGGPNKTVIGAGAGIVAFLVLLILRRRRR